ncbi:MAG: AAA family ATPase [Proteobacteria bacterium]|nr:AAA family ATPase [Pseudomonadota bacterium]
MNFYDQLWVQKYAPKTLDDLILSDENREFFSKINEDTPHLLLYGNAGTGKTTLAKIIVNDVLKCQYLYINASDENGVDTIRNKVISFSQTRSFDSKKKVIILDEFCGTTPEAQRILRNVMEEYAGTTRFILTANYLNRIIEPIQSRCLMFNIVPKLDQCAVRCLHILKSENIKVGNNMDFVLFLKNNFPDMRRIINDLQKFSITGEVVITQNTNVKDLAVNIFNDLISKKPIFEIRKTVLEQERKFGSNYQELFKQIFDLIYESSISDDIKRQAMIELGEFLYRDNIVLDHEINFFCCLLALSKII